MTLITVIIENERKLHFKAAWFMTGINQSFMLFSEQLEQNVPLKFATSSVCYPNYPDTSSHQTHPKILTILFYNLIWFVKCSDIFEKAWME